MAQQCDIPVATPPSAGLEVRVHGIGDHEIFSALDGPTSSEEVTARNVSVDGPPRVPGHRLRMVNWSRANRKLTASTAWYLAFPFTLLNVAGYMVPTRTRVDRTLRAALFTTGLSMTLAVAVWIAAIAETVWRWVSPDPNPVATVLLSWVPPLAVASIALYRLWRGRQNANRCSAALSLITVAALLALTLALLDAAAGLRYPFTGRPVDIMTIFVASTTVIAWSTAFLLALRALYFRFGKRSSAESPIKADAPYAGAALLCLLGMAVLHAGGAILRLATVSIADAFTPGPATVNGSTMLIFQPQPGTVERFSLAQPLRIDLLPLFVIEFALVLAVALVAGFRVSMLRRTAREQLRARKTALGYRTVDGASGRPLQHTGRWHDLTSDLPRTLTVTAFVTVIAVGAAWLGTAWVLRTSWPDLDHLVWVLKAGGIVILSALVVRRPRRLSAKIRDLLARLGDVAGFWSPDLHPLAGTSYRLDVLAGIETALRDQGDAPAVLVGHSQGSVVTAWYAATLGCADWQRKSDADMAGEFADCGSAQSDETRRPMLITCGSPLESLYATFFPHYFSAEFFDRVHDNTGGRWINFWRQTDPIATPVPCASNENITESGHAPILGHSKYFTDPRVEETIRQLIAGERLRGGQRLHPRSTFITNSTAIKHRTVTRTETIQGESK